MTHLDRALQLAADGYPVLPCNASTKAPLIAGGLLAASTDPAAIRAMPWPEPCLVGIRTGSRESGGCGYDVLDVDAAAGGDAWFGEAVRRIPPTRIQQTRRAGGLHLWFEAKPGARCSAGRIAAGVDVRAEHGYVIDWAGEGVPQWLDEPVTPWPAWLGEMVGRRADHGTVDLSDTAAVAAVAPPSVEAVVSLLQRMRNDHGVDRGVWLGVMMAAADCAKITGDEHGAIREAAIEWAARYSGDAEAEEAKWDDDWMSRPVKTGWPGLEHHAVTLLPGYQVEQAAAEFGALPPAPPPPAGRRSIVTPAQCDGISARPYRIKGLLAERDVACLFGPPGAGKSLLGPYIGYRVAVGAECFGMRCKPGSVLYVAAEDESGMERRVAALRGRLGEAEAFGLVRGVSDLNIGSPDLAWLLAEVEARRPALVVIDTLAMAFPGTIENEAESMGRIVAVSRRLTEWGAAVLLIHHSSKAQDGTPRGHSLLNGALDMAIALEGRDDEGVVRGRLTKNRSGGCETVFAFRIGVAELGRDEDGDAITAAMCEPLAAGEGVRPPPLTPKQSAAVRLLTSMTADAGGEAVPASDWMAACAELSGGSDDKARRRTAVRIRDELASKGVIWHDAGAVGLPGAGSSGVMPGSINSDLQTIENTGAGSTGSSGVNGGSGPGVKGSTGSRPLRRDPLTPAPVTHEKEKEETPLDAVGMADAESLAALLR